MSKTFQVIDEGIAYGFEAAEEGGYTNGGLT